MENIKPVRPEDVFKQEEHTIHPSMIRAINLFLTRFDGKQAIITVEELIDKFLEFESKWTRDMIWKKKQLDFEGLYKDSGWDVIYDKPGYEETYKPFYLFKLKK